MMPSSTAEEKHAKSRDMEALVQWYSNALSTNEGLAGVLKPDFLGFNHNGYYASAYTPHAVHMVACEQALLFGRAKRASRERASEGPRKGELATISHKFSFPPRKPRDSTKRENCHRKRAAD